MARNQEPSVYKRQVKGKNGTKVLTKFYYFKGKLNGKRKDINTQCSVKRDAVAYAKQWVEAPENAVATFVGKPKITKILGKDTIVDIMKREGWFSAETNPKYRKSISEKKVYGIAQAKKISNTLRFMFWNIDDLNAFDTYTRRNKVLLNTKIEDYINFRTKPVNELIKNDAVKLLNFLNEYTAWLKKNKITPKDKYYMNQNTINIGALKAFFTFSYENNVVGSNIFHLISIPRNSKDKMKKKNKFTIKQLKIMFNDDIARKSNKEIFESNYYRAFKFQALTGMRNSEIKAMTWRQVGIDKHNLLIDAAYKENVIKRTAIGKPKSGVERNIYLCDSAVECLGERRDDNSFVFPSRKGSAMSSNQYSIKYQQFLESVEIECKQIGIPFLNGERFTPHCHRGTLNSLLVSTGELADSLIQDYLGWTKDALTPVQKTSYTKFTEEGLFKVARQIERFFSGKEMIWKKEEEHSDDNIDDIVSRILANKNDKVKILPSKNKTMDYGIYKEMDEFLDDMEESYEERMERLREEEEEEEDEWD